LKQLAKTHGRLLAIEGIDQAGKKTQTQLLAKELRRQGYRVSIWEFPDYSTRLGRQIKSYLAGDIRLDLHVVHLLYSANRWEVAEKLEQEIRGGINVVVNRYWPSNLAYGIAHGLRADWLSTLDDELPKPDLVIILDIPPHTSMKRKRKERDVHESDLTYLRKVRKAYLQLARKYHWRIVDGARDTETVQGELRNIVTRRFPQ